MYMYTYIAYVRVHVDVHALAHTHAHAHQHAHAHGQVRGQHVHAMHALFDLLLFKIEQSGVSFDLLQSIASCSHDLLQNKVALHTI